MDIISSRRPSKSPERDPSTLSNYQSFKVNSTSLDFDVSFEKKVVTGSVKYDLDVVEKVQSVDLDTSFLVIKKAYVDGKETTFDLKERSEPLGSKLVISLPEGISKTEVSIDFETTTKCTALQFLEKEATDGKVSPYLFSQCQAIHARSLFPCFDTPAVKSTFKFKTKSPLPTLLSGLHKGTEGDIYLFEQPIPIPSYLVAIASGDIVSAKIGRRSHVFCEPVKIDACQYEFESDMEKFIETAEKLIFHYEWDQYDALVLPSSFPYGGMENPNITFVTPTLISGDRQNVDVVAHELAHSWSGNLVTNCSWEHFWLNEGWTVYIERRIQGAVHGESSRDFSAIIGWTTLENAVNSMNAKGTGDRFTRLVQDLKDGSDPDDAFSTVPYEKGSNLLYHIEQRLGGKEVFDPFIPHYFNKFKYRSLDTYQFLDTLYEFFKDKKAILDSIDWEAWLYAPGMPPTKPAFDTTLVDECYALADKWYKHIISGKSDYSSVFNANDVKSFIANQDVVFLDTLISYKHNDGFEWRSHQDALAAMSEIYSSYNSSVNAEVLFRWFVLQVSSHRTEFYDKLGEWLGTVGRMKFVRPGYVLLNKVDHDLAIKYFRKFESVYHPICQGLVRRDLGLS